MARRKVCVDTQLMIWGVKGESSANRIEMKKKAEHFIKSLIAENAKIVVPSVVLAEMMCNVPEDERVSVLNGFTKNFQIQPFDTRTALIYAETFYKKKIVPGDASNESMNGNRKTIIADIMIVASAKASDAATLYSEDSDIQKLSAGIIGFSSLPEPKGQMDLFEESK